LRKRDFVYKGLPPTRKPGPAPSLSEMDVEDEIKFQFLKNISKKSSTTEELVECIHTIRKRKVEEAGGNSFNLPPLKSTANSKWSKAIAPVVVQEAHFQNDRRLQAETDLYNGFSLATILSAMCLNDETQKLDRIDPGDFYNIDAIEGPTPWTSQDI
jgi:hypothetical protein